jgi:hypothetical protein
VGNKALHNRLHDSPHNAILMGGNDHEIAYNESAGHASENAAST